MDWPELLIAAEKELMARVAPSSTGGSALVIGPPGIGKTTLLGRAARNLAAGGAATRWLVGSASDRGAAFSSLGGLLSSTSTAAVLRTSDVYRLAFAEMVDAPLGSTITVFVDDAHLIDEASAGLLQKLASAGAIKIVAAARSLDDTGPGIHALWASGLLHQVSLGPLDRGQTESVLSTVLGPRVHPLTRAELFTTSGGTPLLLREIIAASLDSGHLEETEGWWRLRTGWETSTRIAAAARYVFGDIDPAALEPLQTLAITGALELPAFERLSTGNDLEILEARNLVRVVGRRSRTTVRIEHALLDRTLRGMLPTARHRRLAQTASEVLVELGGRRSTDHVRIASWRLEAGLDVAPTTALRAAESMLAELDGASATDMAWTAVHGTPQEFQAHMVLAEAHSLTGRVGPADAALRTAAQLAVKRKQRARCAVAAMHNIAVGGGRWRDAVKQGKKTARDLEGSRAGRDLRAEVDLMLVRLGRDPIASADAVPAGSSKAASRRGVHDLTASALATAERQTNVGRFEHALETINQADMRPSSGVRFAIAEHELALQSVAIRTLLGETATARSIARDHLQAAVEDRSDPLVGAWSAALGDTLMASGRIAEAAHHYDDALVTLEQHDVFALWLKTRARRALAAIHLRDIAGAAAALEGLAPSDLALITDRESHTRARRWLDATTGHRKRAAEGAAETAESLLELGQVARAALAAHDAVRFGHADLAVPLLEPASDADGVLLPSLFAHARAAAREDGGGLAAVAESLLRCDAKLLAAEAYTQAADAFAATDDRTRARTCAEKAAMLRMDLPEVHTPALTRNDGVLTPREAEIARLAAGGESSKQIAESLAISARTVDNHLAAVYVKLGIRGRDRLAAVLGVADAR